MAYEPPSPFVLVVAPGYSPPSPFVFTIGEAPPTIAHGAVVQPVDTVSGLATSPLAASCDFEQPADSVYGSAWSTLVATGDFQQPADTVYGAQRYVAGDFQQPVDTVYGSAVSALLAFGDIHQPADSFSGVAQNDAPLSDFIAGDFQPPVDKISGSAQNHVGVGRVYAQVDSCAGEAITSSVCRGRVKQYKDSVSGFGFIAISRGAGSFLQPVDILSGEAIAPIVARGSCSQKADTLRGDASSPLVRFAHGNVVQRVDTLLSEAVVITPSRGKVSQRVDAVGGVGYSVCVAHGLFSNPCDKIAGLINRLQNDDVLHFSRDEFLNDSLSSPLTIDPLEFNGGEITTGTVESTAFTPLAFSR